MELKDGGAAMHPGQMLRDGLLKDMDITQEELAEALAVSRFTVNQVLNGRRSITPNMALRLARVLGIDAEMLVCMQSRHDLEQARNRLHGQLDRLTRLVD